MRPQYIFFSSTGYMHDVNAMHSLLWPFHELIEVKWTLSYFRFFLCFHFNHDNEWRALNPSPGLMFLFLFSFFFRSVSMLVSEYEIVQVHAVCCAVLWTDKRLTRTQSTQEEWCDLSAQTRVLNILGADGSCEARKSCSSKSILSIPCTCFPFRHFTIINTTNNKSEPISEQNELYMSRARYYGWTGHGALWLNHQFFNVWILWLALGCLCIVHGFRNSGIISPDLTDGTCVR